MEKDEIILGMNGHEFYEYFHFYSVYGRSCVHGKTACLSIFGLLNMTQFLVDVGNIFRRIACIHH